MQQTLNALLELQEIDDKIDELIDERGDLPLIVNELEKKQELKNTTVTELEEAIKNIKVRIRELELFEKESGEKLQLENEKLYQVKNNKEYDAITSEIEAIQENLEKNSKELDTIKAQLDEKVAILTETESELETINEQLIENKKELNESLAETAGEEKKLGRKRAKLIKQFDEAILQTYDTVRKARSGKAVAPVINGNCGGCYSYIPPQKVVEIRKAKKIQECEFCGRILVWDERLEQ